MNLARFTISGTPSTAGGFDIDPGVVPSLRLEASSSLVGRVTFEVHSSVGGPKASYQAPILTLNNGLTTGQSVDAATPSSTVTVSAGIPGFREPHTWAIRCKVNGGTNPDGSVNPDYVFERYLVMRSASLRRKILPGERFEYDPNESWAGAFNEFVDVESAESTAEGLIELLDADVGVTTYAGNITEWRGNRGHIARPLTRDQALDYSLSGGRRAVSFNGTSHGMTLELPELRRNNSSLIIAVQFYPTYTSASQTLAQLWKTEDTNAVLRVGLEGPVYGGWAANNNDTLASCVKTGADPLNTETIIECARVPATTYSVISYANGTICSPIGNVDVLSPQPASTTLSIGCTVGSTVGSYYNGLIRRIAIYGHTNASYLAANATARYAQWMGN